MSDISPNDNPMISGIQAIAVERQRQIVEEGWDLKHDLQHSPEHLELAATCYATPPEFRKCYDDGTPYLWPWERSWWKPSENRVRDLEKAGALLAAAIDLRKYELYHKGDSDGTEN